MLTRHLLATFGGTGSFADAEPIPAEATITSAPDGGWCSVTASAIHSNGIVYIGYIDAAGNDKIVTYTEATGASSAPYTLHGALEVDWHDNPAITVRADGRIVVAYSKHAGTAMYVRISTNPEDITAWGTETNIGSMLGGDAYTYPALFLDGDRLYLFYRHELSDGFATAKWCYSTSVDGGTTWAGETALYSKTHTVTYMHIDHDGAGRFDFAVTDGTTTGDAASVYHFYMADGSRHKSDGTLISAALPLAPSDLTLVYSGATSGARYPYSIVGFGGLPVITFPAHVGGGEDWWYATWTGAAWSTHNVVSDGPGGTGWVEGGFAPEYANPGVCWVSRAIAGRYQVFRYQAWDAGTTWSSTQISTSASDDFYPVVVRNSRRLRVVWLRGTAASYTDYSLGIMGVALP